MGENKRPRRRHRRGVEALKSLLILVLSLSAFYLTLLALDYSRVEWAPIQAVLSLFRPEQEQASASGTLAPSGQAAQVSPLPAILDCPINRNRSALSAFILPPFPDLLSVRFYYLFSVSSK